MKAPFLMIAALLGSAAVAQTAPDANAPASTPAASTPAASTDAAAAATMAAPTAPPATTDATPGMASNAQVATTDTSNYPVCSRTVTDKCVQRGAAHKTHRHR